MDAARLSHQNMVAAFSLLPVHHHTGFLERVGGFVVAVTGSPVPFFNQVLPFGNAVATDALAEAVQRVRRAGVGWVLQLRGGVDEALLPTVRKLGLTEHAESMPAMIHHLPMTATPAPEGLEIRRVSDDADFDDYVAAGSPATRTWLGARIRQDASVALYTGKVDRTPVATSMSVRTGEVLGIYNVGTIESFRRRGYGWAMTSAAIEDASATSCTLATLQSSAPGLSIYRGHGFRTLYRYRLFGDPLAASERHNDTHES